MNRTPPPCGTDAAYQRHLLNDEPVDDPCLLAHQHSQRTYQAKYTANFRRRTPTGRATGRLQLLHPIDYAQLLAEEETPRKDTE